MAPSPANPPRIGRSELREELAAFESLSRGLVLLEEIPEAELFERIARFDKLLREHLNGAAPSLEQGPPDGPLGEEHRRFVEAVGVLEWLGGIVAHDGHGGNRQALGQYGKILSEALRDHLDREEGTEAPSGPHGPLGQGNRNSP